MTIKEFTDQFKDLNEKGFSTTEDVQAIVWKRSDTNRTEEISMGYRDYLPERFYIRSVIAEISFHKMEKLFDKIAVRVKLPAGTIVERYTITKVFDRVDGSDIVISDIAIHDKKSLDKASKMAAEIIEKGVLPFMASNTRLEEVHQKVEGMKGAEMVDFLAQPIPLKRMIMKKLCNDPDFENYSRMIIDFYKNENNEFWRIAETFYNEIIESLK